MDDDYEECYDDNADYDDYDPYQNEIGEEVVKAATFESNIYYQTVQDLYHHVQEKCDKQILVIFSNLSFDHMVILLLAYEFNFERLKDQLGQDSDNVLKKYKIGQHKQFKQIECQVCLETFKGHFYSCCGTICQSCLLQHIKMAITEWKLEISCPCCDQKVYPSTLPKEVFFEFKRRFVTRFMRAQPNYIQCLDCHKYIQFWKFKKVVECECHCEICRFCGAFAHQPLNCDAYKKWNEKIVDESRNILWIMKNSKKCRNCGWFIQKNSGCNHMTCKQCKYQFCWLCLGNWSQHRHCAAYDQKGSVLEHQIKMSSEDVKKLEFYGIRYQNFQDGEKYAKIMKEKLPSQINILSIILQKRQSEFNFFYEALNIIVMTRRRVKCLYAYIFMAKLTETQKAVLEFNLETIQTSLQQLTFTIEGILNGLDQNNTQKIDLTQILALEKKIKEYKDEIYKFMNLILVDASEKKF